MSFDRARKANKIKLRIKAFLSADSFSSALQVLSSKGDEEGGRENFLTRFCEPRKEA